MRKMESIGIFIFCIVLIISFISIVEGRLDTDMDTVPDEDDKCPNTPKNSVVDKNGCDNFEFCHNLVCGPACEYADFMDDEPNVKKPNDCGTFIIVREGVYYPTCLPLMCPAHKQLLLPDFKIQMIVESGAPNSFILTDLNGIGEGYGPLNDSFIYTGWCMDEFTDIFPGNLYRNVTVYSSTDPNLFSKCTKCARIGWNRINYIINHKHPNATGDDIQAALWYFSNPLGPPATLPSDPETRAMVIDAQANGGTFRPLPGQFTAIILDAGIGVQLTIIEVDP